MCFETERAKRAKRMERHERRGIRGPGEAASGRGRRGFSLVEIMIVIVIIGLLAGMVTINVRSYLTRAKKARVQQDISVIVQALGDFYTVYDRYPTNEEGLAILAQPSEKLPEPPLTAEPRDPWDRPYQYNSPAADAKFEVVCYGADGREGGDGVDADISSTDKNKGDGGS